VVVVGSLVLIEGDVAVVVVSVGCHSLNNVPSLILESSVREMWLAAITPSFSAAVTLAPVPSRLSPI
jgi:hypothetical protein